MQSVVQDPVVVETLPTLYSVTIWGIVVVSGLVWVTLNAYQYYPLLQYLVVDAETDDTDGVDVPGIGYEGSPEIDVFVPAGDEAAAIEQSLASINDSTYPRRKLNVFVLTDPDDTTTRAALTRLRDEHPFTELVVPEGYPGEPNRPRALNYAFDVTTSEVVAVVDAADHVGEQFFEHVAGALVETDCTYALGRLDVADEGDCWLDAQFRAEYATWYGELLPAFQRLDYPVSLAGTICVFTRGVLERAATERTRRFGDPLSDADWDWLADHPDSLVGSTPWDPNSVTGDFDLGLMLWTLDEECRYLGVVTREASLHTYRTWLRQRTRWQRGTFSTLVQHLGRPPADHEKTFHLFGQAGLPYLGAINLVALSGVFSLWYLAGPQPPRAVSSLLLAGVGYAGFAVLLAGYSYGSFSEDRLARRARGAVFIAATRPVYWLLQLIADVQTLVQLSRGGSHSARSAHDDDVTGPDES